MRRIVLFTFVHGNPTNVVESSGRDEGF